jgi:hypothetical protein
MHACGHKLAEAEITSSCSDDETRHIHKLFITVVGLDKTISIGLELAVIANHPSQHIGSSVCMQAHGLHSPRRKLGYGVITPNDKMATQGVKLIS